MEGWIAVQLGQRETGFQWKTVSRFTTYLESQPPIPLCPSHPFAKVKHNVSVPPRFIYFDLGNVLLHFDHDVACRQMAEVAGVSPALVRDIVFDGELQRRYELGKISSGEFHDLFCRRAGTRPPYDALVEAASAIFELNLGVVPIVTQLSAAGYRLGILSNTCEAHWDYISGGRYAMVPEMFEVYALSFRIGAMKPSRDIYEAAAQLAGVRPEEVFFTDDRQENVVAAKASGFDAVLYSTPDDLARDLVSRGVELI